ncbi:glycosyltransferase family 2 protein [Mammaliicoccus sciuri]|uniref:glycosyltransferase family 2 protein n=1 Tax=Mammaliicoccus sciuri TaxID=1296 RepID=UPI003F56888F
MEKYLDISVVIPYYKSYKTILKAIKSITTQTILPREIIIIDDYSNTEEDEKILNHISKNDNIRVINLKKNVGPGSARNYGMNQAKGKYIAFLDSDDSWHKNKLEIQYKIMEETSAFISTHHTVIAGSIEKNSGKVNNITISQQFIRNRFATRAVMLKNDEKYRFKEEKRYAEDFLLWTQILLDNKKAIYIDKTLAYSYKDDFGVGGLSGDLRKMYLGGIDAYKTLKDQKYINSITFLLLVGYQTIKYNIRLIRKSLKGLKT